MNWIKLIDGAVLLSTLVVSDDIDGGSCGAVVVSLDHDACRWGWRVWRVELVVAFAKRGFKGNASSVELAVRRL